MMQRVGQARLQQGPCACCHQSLRVKSLCAIALFAVLTVLSFCERPIRQTYWLPCARIDCKSAATLANAPLRMLRDRRRQHDMEITSDFHEMNGKKAANLLNTYFDIPKIVHQVWLGEQEPPLAWINSWRYGLVSTCKRWRSSLVTARPFCRHDYVQHCVGWSHMLWTPANFTVLRYLDTKLLEPETILSGQADIVRGAVLLEHGGIYVDADSLWVNDQCLYDILELGSTTGFLTAIEPAGDEGMCSDRVANGVMAAVKHHPVVREYMQVQRFFTISKGIGVHPWERLGPLALTAAISVADNFDCTSLTRHWSQNATLPAGEVMLATVLHPQYFYPKSWHGISQQTASNISLIKHMIAQERPAGMMFQFGLTTNGLKTAGVN